MWKTKELRDWKQICKKKSVDINNWTKKEKKKKNMNREKIMKGMNKQKKMKKEENEGLMLGHRCLLNIACLP